MSCHASPRAAWHVPGRDEEPSIHEDPPRLRSVAGQGGSRQSELVIATVVVLPVQQHAPARPVGVAGLRQDVEVTSHQNGGLIQVVRIAPHQATIGEAIADRQR